MILTKHAFSLLVLVFLAAQPAGAVAIISNLASTDDSPRYFVGDNGNGVEIRHGVSFTTAAGGPMSIDDIVVRLDDLDAGDDPLIRLFSDVGGAAGIPLVTFTAPTLIAGVNNHTLTPIAPFSLLGSTTYWLVMQNVNFPAGALFDWVGDGDAFIGSATFNGSDAGVFGGDPNGPPSSIRAPVFEVNASSASVPVPSTMLLLGLGATSFFGVRRRWKAGREVA